MAEFDLGAGGDDRRFVFKPPFLRLQVVAGAGFLFFGHRFMAKLWLALCRSWLFMRAGSVFRSKASVGDSVVDQLLRKRSGLARASVCSAYGARSV